MAYNPGVSFFILFQALDPKSQSQCIFFTQKGARCKWSCQANDNERAKELYDSITALPAGDVSLEMLREYVLCNCCRSGRARHRDKIEDIGLLFPLAQRWQDEIRRRAADHSNAPTLFGINAGPSQLVASSQSSIRSSQGDSNTVESEPRYDLRHREGPVSTGYTSTSTIPIPQPPLSEFRPHMADLSPTDSVSYKMLDALEDRDFETGSLYIFDRDSSPGHVKIGWTARSVQGRLQDWSRCGYTPHLRFSVHGVPHAQRAETLSHYELIKEWRRERMCKAPWCRKPHQEWFEVSKERAAEVVGDWARFFKMAEPYDVNGVLNSAWRDTIKVMDKHNEAITAKRLLKYHEASLAEERPRAEELAIPEKAPKIEESDFDPVHSAQVPDLETSKEAISHVSSSWTERPSQLEGRALFEDKAVAKSTPLVSFLLAQAKPSVKVDQLMKKGPLQTVEPPFPIGIPPKSEFDFTFGSPIKTKSLPTTEALSTIKLIPKSIGNFTFGSPIKTEKLPMTEPSFTIGIPPKSEFNFTFGSPIKTKPLPTTKPLFESRLPSKAEFDFTFGAPFKREPLPAAAVPFQAVRLPVTEPPSSNTPREGDKPEAKIVPTNEELKPEQIPLPPSPLIQPIICPEDRLRLVGEGPSPHTRVQKTSAIDATTKSNTSISTVDAPPSQIDNSMLLPAPASASATTDKIVSDMNTHTITTAGTRTNSELLNFPMPSSEPSSSNSSFTVGSSDFKTEAVPKVVALPQIELSEAMLSLQIDEQMRIAETCLSSIRVRQDVEGELTQSIERTSEERMPRNRDKSVAAETETGTTTEGWHLEGALLQDISLKMSTLTTVEVLYSELTTGDAKGALNALDGSKERQMEAQVVEVAS